MFLDYPNVGMALRRVQALISSVAIKKLENFRLLAYSMAYVGFLLPNSTDSTSVLELDWNRLPHVNHNRMWRFEAWQAGDRASSENFPRRAPPPRTLVGRQPLWSSSTAKPGASVCPPSGYAVYPPHCRAN